MHGNYLALYVATNQRNKFLLAVANGVLSGLTYSDNTVLFMAQIA